MVIIDESSLTEWKVTSNNLERLLQYVSGIIGKPVYQDLDSYTIHIDGYQPKIKRVYTRNRTFYAFYAKRMK